MPPLKFLTLQTQKDLISFDPATARLVSFRSQSTPDQEFIASSDQHPVFVIGFFGPERAYHQIDSLQAGSVSIENRLQDGQSTILAHYKQIAGYDLDIHFSISASSDSPFSRWRIKVENRSNLEVFNVQFPFVVCSYDLAGKPESERLVLPHGYCTGQLIRDFKGEESPISPYGVFWRRKLKPDTWTAWLWNEGSIDHYPGWQFAQFLAYYNDRAGIYLACEDTGGFLKSFKVLDREPGFRLAVAHIGDWPQAGVRTIEYDTLLGSFQGDWYTAADIYREWSLKQKWAIPLHQQQDLPAWLLDSPVYITIRPQGVLDEGPVFPVDEFLPYEKCIPLLEGIAQKVDAPIAAVLMGWERAGSWIYPDCFPPIGGDESLANFTRQARARGWHVGSFSNGTQWLIGDGWNGYDGQTYFRENGGEKAICRRPDGSGWLNSNYWRPGYPCCMGTPLTRQIASDYVRRLVGWGFEFDPILRPELLCGYVCLLRQGPRASPITRTLDERENGSIGCRIPDNSQRGWGDWGDSLDRVGRQRVLPAAFSRGGCTCLPTWMGKGRYRASERDSSLPVPFPRVPGAERDDELGTGAISRRNQLCH